MNNYCNTCNIGNTEAGITLGNNKKRKTTPIIKKKIVYIKLSRNGRPLGCAK